MVRPTNWAVVNQAYMVMSSPGAVRNQARIRGSVASLIPWVMGM